MCQVMQTYPLDDVAVQTALHHVRIKKAGGLHEHFVLHTTYAPSKGTRKRVFSNHREYGKSWATKEEITNQDKINFLEWIDKGLARGGGSSKGRRDQTRAVQRSSLRTDASTISLSFAGIANMEVEQGVWACVNALINKVCYQSRWHQAKGQVRVSHSVPSKRRPRHLKLQHGPTSLQACYRRCRGLISKRYASQKLTQRRSRAYAYRTERLKRAAASRAEENLSWLQHHQLRLATIIARQDLLELLPEGTVRV